MDIFTYCNYTQWYNAILPISCLPTRLQQIVATFESAISELMQNGQLYNWISTS